jgi:hypothetical protein
MVEMPYTDELMNWLNENKVHDFTYDVLPTDADVEKVPVPDSCPEDPCVDHIKLAGSVGNLFTFQPQDRTGVVGMPTSYFLREGREFPPSVEKVRLAGNEPCVEVGIIFAYHCNLSSGKKVSQR